VNKIKGKIVWDLGKGRGWARCTCTDPPRKLTQEEVDITYISLSSGDLRTSGVVKCRECGKIFKWDTSLDVLSDGL